MRVPRATYRLQFNEQFGFIQAAGIIEYLNDLGISDLYASPLMTATAGSTHGYDVCDFERISPGLGGVKAFEQLSNELDRSCLGLLLDIVPNHMGNDLSNKWWHSLLEHGPASPYARYFDVEWSAFQPNGLKQVLLPVLEDHYYKVLEAGKLKLCFKNGAFALSYYQNNFPCSIRSYVAILEAIWGNGGRSQQEENLIQGLNLLLKARADAEQERSSSTLLEFQQAKSQLGTLASQSRDFAAVVQETVTRLNGCPGVPESFEALDRLLNLQHYRLAHWKTGPEEINYRRFFDVTQLVSLRMERPEVFANAHRLVLDLIGKKIVTGLRIDHPDGLLDPGGYLLTLQQAIRQTLGSPPEAPFYIVVEKILTGTEVLRRDWKTAGTTGYDFLNQVNGVLIDSAARDEADRFYQSFTGIRQDLEGLVYNNKKLILQESLVSELHSLTRRAKKLATRSRRGRDLTTSMLRAALMEVIACFPTYRSYATATTREMPVAEFGWIKTAVETARRKVPQIDSECFSFLESLLMLEDAQASTEETPPAPFKQSTLQSELRLQPSTGMREAEERVLSESREFVLRFQQLTGPVMAKGLEDTTFYNYYRFISVNEVGGDPGRFGIAVEDFHAMNLARAESWPHSLLATATHDTKRGEDVRARLNVISELIAEWGELVERWREMNIPAKTALGGSLAPSANDEYMIYQMLVGAWPVSAADGDAMKVFLERISTYLLKALKEAKTHTSWTRPNHDYESAAATFLNRILDRRLSLEFLNSFEQFQQMVAFFGIFNSLTQLVLKLTSPGVPDIYQGTEFLDLSLVDPDNRRPVDFELRRAALGQVVKAGEKLPAEWILEDGGRVKLFCMRKLLRLRQISTKLFQEGTYVPLEVEGDARSHVIAFQRSYGQEMAVVVVPRLVCRLMNKKRLPPLGNEVWRATNVKVQGQFQNVFTGAKLLSRPEGLGAGDIFASCPVAVLVRTVR